MQQMISLPRLLWGLLIAVFVLLTAKTLLMWGEAALQLRVAGPISAAQAASAGKSSGHGEGETVSSDGHGSPAENAAAGSESGKADPASSSSPASANSRASSESSPHGQPEFSNEEVAVLQKLAKRREALDRRGDEIGRREALLHAAEARIEQKIARLEELRAVLQSLIENHDAAQEQKLTSLVKIYENMKPKDAARIFEELDMQTLLPVAERMKERKLAGIMAQMNPSKAKEMTVELAQLRRLIDQTQGYSAPRG